MKVKLGVELTIRIEEDDLNLWDLRDIARKYMTEGKYIINNIKFIADYRDETSIVSKQQCSTEVENKE